MDPRSPAEATHCVPQFRVDERVHDDGRVSPSAPNGALEIVNCLRTRVTNLLELLIWKLRLERHNEARSRLTG